MPRFDDSAAPNLFAIAVVDFPSIRAVRTLKEIVLAQDERPTADAGQPKRRGRVQNLAAVSLSMFVRLPYTPCGRLQSDSRPPGDLPYPLRGLSTFAGTFYSLLCHNGS
jgi:hypothetical protein